MFTIQAYKIIFWLLYTLQHANYQEFSFHSSPCTWLPLCILPFPHLISANHYSVLCVYFCLVCLLTLPPPTHIWKKSYSICLFLSYFTGIIPSRSIHVVANGKISSLKKKKIFLSRIVFPCFKYILHLFYPVIHGWQLRLFTYLDSCM